MELLIEAALYVGGAITLMTGVIVLIDWSERRALKRPPSDIREDIIFLDEPPYLGVVTTIDAKPVKRKVDAPGNREHATRRQLAHEHGRARN